MENYAVHPEEIILNRKIGNISKFEQLIQAIKTDSPEVYKTMLVNRNNNWLPKIEEFLKTDEVEFIVFGAFHLYGEDGVLQLLKTKGYTIEQAIF